MSEDVEAWVTCVLESIRTPKGEYRDPVTIRLAGVPREGELVFIGEDNDHFTVSTVLWSDDGTVQLRGWW